MYRNSPWKLGVVGPVVLFMAVAGGCGPVYEPYEPIIKPVPGSLSERTCEEFYKLAATGQVDRLLSKLDSLDEHNAVCAPANQGLLYMTMKHANPESAVALAEKYGVNTPVTAVISSLGSSKGERLEQSLFAAAVSVLHVADGIVSDSTKYPESMESQLNYVDSANVSAPFISLINHVLENELPLGPNRLGSTVADHIAGCPIWWGCRNYLGLDGWEKIMTVLLDKGAVLTGHGQAGLLLTCKNAEIGNQGLTPDRREACDNVLEFYLSRADAETFEPRLVSHLVENNHRDEFRKVLDAGFVGFDEEIVPWHADDEVLFGTVRETAAAVQTDYFTRTIREAEKKITGLSESEFVKLARSSLSDAVFRNLLETRGTKFSLDSEAVLRLSGQVEDKYIEMLQEVSP